MFDQAHRIDSAALHTLKVTPPLCEAERQPSRGGEVVQVLDTDFDEDLVTDQGLLVLNRKMGSNDLS